jgi:hypothetical protein
MSTLKRLVRAHNPNVILIQETMVVGSKTQPAFEPWLNDWSFCSLDVDGILGGSFSAWSPTLGALSTSTLNSTIMVDLEIKELGISLKIFNVYGPCLDMKPYWENLELRVTPPLS